MRGSPQRVSPHFWQHRTRVEEDDGAKTPQLGFIHPHVAHLRDQLSQHPVGWEHRGGSAGFQGPPPGREPPRFAPHLSKMAPTPALWALLRWTWRPVAKRIPSLTVMERCEKEAMSSSFQPGGPNRGQDPPKILRGHPETPPPAPHIQSPQRHGAHTPQLRLGMPQRSLEAPLLEEGK